MKKYSNVTIRGEGVSKRVMITSDEKPEISEEVVSKWQSLLDTTATILKVPSGLIMRLNEETIEVFLRSNTSGNPYEKGEEAKLIYGLYCETVIGTQRNLIVSDAKTDSVWKDNNPDIDLNMVSYLGTPVNWPDGEVFGTVCFLDSKGNDFGSEFTNFINQIKYLLENDLLLLCRNKELTEKNKELEMLNDTKLRFLSLISHDVRGGIGIIDEFTRYILQNFEEFEQKKLKKVLESLTQRTNAAMTLLENLLNWSKNDMHSIEPNFRSFDMIKVLEKLIDYFEPATMLKNVSVNKFFKPENAVIWGDENMITVCVRNVLSNAIKYTDRGGKIDVRLELKNNSAILEIEDNGVGMSLDMIEKLFSYNKEYYQKGTMGESSAGIGLILTKEFLDKNNANIFVTSREGIGTKISIHLRLSEKNVVSRDDGKEGPFWF